MEFYGFEHAIELDHLTDEQILQLEKIFELLLKLIFQSFTINLLDW